MCACGFVLAQALARAVILGDKAPEPLTGLLFGDLRSKELGRGGGIFPNASPQSCLPMSVVRRMLEVCYTEEFQ